MNIILKKRRRIGIIIILLIELLYICINSFLYNKYSKLKLSKEEIKDIISKELDLSQTYLSIKEILEKNNITEDYELIQDLVMNKCKNKTLKFEITSDDISIDSVYWTIFEECYIVDLIQRHSKKETSIKNYKYNVNYLINNYNDFIEFDKIDVKNNYERKLFFINHYIEDYSHESVIKNNLFIIKPNNYQALL